MSEVKLTAEKRTEFGKGAARRLRRAQMVPAVLYGHGAEPVHVALPGHATMMALKNSNALLSLDLGGGRNELALPKDVQRNPVKGVIEHVDLLLVRRGETVTVDVPVHVTGDPVSGALVTTELSPVEIEVEATNIPQFLEVSVEDMEAGTHISAGEVALPEGATLVTDPEALVVHVSAPTEEPSDAAEAAEPEADAAE